MTLCRTFKFYAPTIKTNGSFYIPGGDAKVSFVDVRDIAAVASKVLMEHDEGEMRHFGKAYNITGPEALSYYQAAEILSNTYRSSIGLCVLRMCKLSTIVEIKMPNQTTLFYQGSC
jgi:nucleoside-diphosphate-sugar epimerase